MLKKNENTNINDLYDGPAMVSTGQRVRIVALGKVEAVRVGVSRPKTQTKVNAKTSTTMGTVKVKAAKGFRFGGSKVAQAEAAFA